MKKFEIKGTDDDKWSRTTRFQNSPVFLKIKDLTMKGPSQGFGTLQVIQKKSFYYKKWKNGSKSIIWKK